MKLSVIVPSPAGEVPQSLRAQADGRSDVEIVSVVGLRPVGRARNEGLRRATGEYLAWVDSDDEVTDDWLAEIFKAIASGPDALLIDVKCEGWDSLGSLVYGGAPEGILPALYTDHLIPAMLVRFVIRRELWRGLRFDESVQAYEDFLMLPQVLGRARRISYVPRPLYRYICRKGSTSRAIDVRRIEQCLEVAMRRYGETPEAYREPSLFGSMHVIYHALSGLSLDAECRSLRPNPQVVRSARRFLLRHLFEVRCPLHERLRHVTAILGFFWFQHLARKLSLRASRVSS